MEPDHSFEYLLTAEYGRVLAIAMVLLPCREAAEQVTQEVFLRCQRLLPANAPCASAWLHAASARRALTQARKNPATTPPMVRSGEGKAANPGRQPTRDEQVHQVALQALAQLPAHSAMVLALRYSGLSYAETAAALGVPIPRASLLLARAEAALNRKVSHAPSP